MGTFVNFILHPLPSQENDYNEKLKDISDKLKNANNSSSLNSTFNSIKSIPVLECIVSHSHIALLLKDGKICRVSYSLIPERLDFTNNANEKIIQNKTNSQNNAPRLGSSSGARRGGRLIRTSSSSSNRGRAASGVIMGRALVPAQFVPEDLISQAQVVLQGKSRNLIVKELQRTNLDVNLAVNNLLSRDDEDAEDMDDSQESYLQSEDLMSLLDAGINNDHGSVLIDADFSEDVFNNNYSSSAVRMRTNSSLNRLSRATSIDRESSLAIQDRDHPMLRFAPERVQYSTNSSSNTGSGGGVGGVGQQQQQQQNSSSGSNAPASSRRWLEYALRDSASASENNSKLTDSQARKAAALQQTQNAFYINGQLEYWQVDNNKKFIQMIGLYSELIAISSTGQLFQWKWNELEPYQCQISDGVTIYHPKVLSLNLINEKITHLAGNCIRASVVTESNKIATLIDESISPVASKLEHPIQSFPEFQNQKDSSSKIVSLYCCSLYTCVRLENNHIYWWGVPPFSHRKKMWEKLKIKSKKQKSQSNSNINSTTTTTATNSNNNNNNEIVQGALVCMRNSPSYNPGSIAFNISSGIPKVGQLMNAAWNVTDTCTFKILTQTELRKLLPSLPSISPMPSSINNLTKDNKDQPSSPSFSKSLASGNLNSISTSITTNTTTATASSSSSSSVNNKNDDKKSNQSSNDQSSILMPPPSPASSTCSEPGASPLPKRTKRISNNNNLLRDDERSSNEETWNLADVVFVEDSKNINIGKVVKIDGAFAAVKFNVNCNSNTTSNSNSNIIILNKEQQQMQNKVIDDQSSTSSSTNINNNNNNNNNLNNLNNNNNTTSSSSDLNYLLQDCRLMKKDDLVLIKNGSQSSKTPDCLQKTPKRIMIPESTNIIQMNISNKGLHAIIKNSLTNKLSYVVYNLINCKIEQDFQIPTDSNSFFGQDQSLISLNCFGEGNENILILTDGNGTIYPLSKDCNNSIKEPINLNLPPIQAMSMCSQPIKDSTTNKNQLAINLIVLENQSIIPAILQSDSDYLRSTLSSFEKNSLNLQSSVAEKIDGNRNILHAAVSMCFPTSNKFQTETNSNEDLNLDNIELLSSSRNDLINCSDIIRLPNQSPSVSNKQQQHHQQQQQQQQDTNNKMDDESNDQLPFGHDLSMYDPSEQKSLSVLWALTESPIIKPYLKDLMSAKNSQGFTPFMLAVNGRAYAAAIHLFQVAQKISKQLFPIDLDQQKKGFMSMIFPRNSNLDDSPLHVLCCNDNCSFTWTSKLASSF